LLNFRLRGKIKPTSSYFHLTISLKCCIFSHSLFHNRPFNCSTPFAGKKPRIVDIVVYKYFQKEYPMKKIVWLIPYLLLTILLLAGCEDRTTVQTENRGEAFNGRVIGTLHGVITMQGTNTPMSGVRVLYSIAGSNLETISDANGYYRIDNLREATYSISYLSPDTNYADWGEVVAVQYDSANAHPTDVDYLVVISRNVMMFRRDAAVSGYVFARLDNETTMPAVGAEIKAMGFAGVLNAEFSTTTDQNGRYTLSGLPATPNCQIMAMPWVGGGVNFGLGVTQANLVSGATVNAANIVLAPATVNIVVLSNNFGNGSFPIDGGLVLVVNKPLEDSSLVIILNRGATPIQTVFNVDTSGLVLTIDPVVLLRASTNYALTVNGRGMDYSAFTYGPVTFSTERGIELVSTTVLRQDGFVRDDVDLDETLSFTFNREIAVSHDDNDAWVRRGTTDILVNWSISQDQKTLSITPLGSYRENTLYTIGFLLYSSLPEDCTAATYNFTTVMEPSPLGQVTGLAQDDTAHVDWNTTQIWLNWNAMANVVTYQVYGYDTYNVTDYRWIANYPATRISGTERNQIALPTEFDWLVGDGMQTPFTNGIDGKFFVRAINAVDEGPFSAELTVSDMVAPRITALTQDRSANNTSPTTPAIVSCRFGTLHEYCMSTPPSWHFEEAGGNPSYHIPDNAATWQWDANMRNGTLRVTVPASSNGAGDRLLLWGVYDNSGNMQPDTTIRLLN
jgi:hypothetical protein